MRHHLFGTPARGGFFISTTPRRLGNGTQLRLFFSAMSRGILVGSTLVILFRASPCLFGSTRPRVFLNALSHRLDFRTQMLKLCFGLLSPGHFHVQPFTKVFSLGSTLRGFCQF
jgi:hypothetical protein